MIDKDYTNRLLSRNQETTDLIKDSFPSILEKGRRKHRTIGFQGLPTDGMYDCLDPNTTQPCLASYIETRGLSVSWGVQRIRKLISEEFWSNHLEKLQKENLEKVGWIQGLSNLETFLKFQPSSVIENMNVFLEVKEKLNLEGDSNLRNIGAYSGWKIEGNDKGVITMDRLIPFVGVYRGLNKISDRLDGFEWGKGVKIYLDHFSEFCKEFDTIKK